MRILNLFAGIGGNRTEWGDSHQITAVEMDPDIAAIYQKRFPNDIVIVGDALEYLLEHHAEFDFIWASPPCQSHTILVVMNFGRYNNTPPIPDMTRLYGVITWLNRWYHGLYCVENVVPYYKSLIRVSVKLERHQFWSNFPIPEKAFPQKRIRIDKVNIHVLGELNKINVEWLRLYKIKSWDQNHDVYRTLLRNCVDYRIGKYILKCAIRTEKKESQKSSLDFFI